MEIQHMEKSIYDILREWQTLLGAMFGFTALLLGAMWNFYLNRKRDAALRREETIAVVAAIYGEILLLRQEVANIGNLVAQRHKNAHWREGEIFDRHFVEDRYFPETFIYQALANKLGFLNPSLIIRIAVFYKNVAEVKFWLPRLLPKEDRVFDYSVLNVLEPVRDAVVGVDIALRQMERIANIDTPAQTPKISWIHAVIEVEQERHSPHPDEE
jgi:hypothetical protein